MISVEKHRLSELLRRHGYSLTKGRMMVFDILRDNPPLSLSELHDALDSQLDRATLYRIVQLFEKLGVIKRITLGWKYKLELSELFSQHHHHLVCVRCGQLVILPEDAVLERRLEALGRQQGFVEVSHQVELQGVCGECREAGK